MKTRNALLAGLAASFLAASLATADESSSSAGAKDTATPATTSSDPTSAKEPQAKLGEKRYKERINVVARKPLRHDLEFTDSRDRESWNGHDTWQGIRDERPMIARKTMGFHDPRPHRTRWERVLLVSRGPIRGPGFEE